jgi:hypothetical protein
MAAARRIHLCRFAARTVTGICRGVHSTTRLAAIKSFRSFAAHLAQIPRSVHLKWLRRWDSASGRQEIDFFRMFNAVANDRQKTDPTGARAHYTPMLERTRFNEIA